jgi:hypothetical protein
MTDYKWLFDGVAGAAAISIAGFIIHRFLKSEPTVANTSVGNANTAVGNSGPVYQQSPTINIQSAANNAALRHGEWTHLIRETEAAIDVMANAFIPVFAYKPGDPRSDPEEGIKRGNAAFASSLLIDDVLNRSGIRDRWLELIVCVQQRDDRAAEIFDGKALGFRHALTKLASEDMGRHN